MITVSNDYKTAAGANLRQPKFQVLVEWVRGSGTFTDESARVLEIEYAQSLTIDGGDILPARGEGRFRVKFRNSGWRYSVGASGGDSTIRGSIGGTEGLTGRKVKIKAGFVLPSTSTEYAEVFRGVVQTWSEDSAGKYVELQGGDRGVEMFQARGAAPMSTNIRTDAWLQTVADTYGGIDPADMVLDAGLFHLPAAWMDDDALGDELRDIAASEAGRIWFDGTGRLRFETALHWLSGSDHTTVCKAFDADDCLNLSPYALTDQLATTVIVEWQERRPDKVREVWALDQAKEILPGQTVYIKARLDAPCRVIYTPEQEKDYWITTTGGQVMHEAVTISLSTPTPAQVAELVLTNNHALLSAVVRYLVIRGEGYSGGPNQEATDDTGVSLEYNRTRSARSNVYIQTQGQADFLLPLLKHRASHAARVYRITDVPAQPYLEIGDLVSITDGRVLDAVTEGYITGYRVNFSLTAGLTADYDILSADDWFPSPTVPGGTEAWFVIGTTPLGGGGCFY